MNEKLREVINSVMLEEKFIYYAVPKNLLDALVQRISREFCLFSHVWIYDENDKRFCARCVVAKEGE